MNSSNSSTPVERGDKVTRLEAFVDAAFAFAVSLLVIAGDEIPRSVEALVAATKSIPTYAASFLLIMRFWTGHTEWSRRFGLDDPVSRRLSLLLVFLVLIFVYPLKMVFASFFVVLSGGWLPANFTLNELAELPRLFIIFGVAFGSMGIVMTMLYWHAWRNRSGLALSPVECINCHTELLICLAVPMTAILSIVIALNLPLRRETGYWFGLPGYIYFLNHFISFWLRQREKRQIAALP